MKVGKWSTTAGNNNATPPDGWPEGQAPSTVNDCGREMMAAIKTLVNTLEYVDLDNTPSFLTTTTFSLGTVDATNWHVGRRVKLFDATTLYGTINSVSGTTVAVRLDSGVLTSSLSSAALAVLGNTAPSLPDAAYQQQNVIINGALEVWQRTASLAGVTNNQYVADRFKYEGVNTASVNINRLERSANSAYVPTLASAGVQLSSSMNVYVSAADAAVAAGDYAAITYPVEGWDFRQIAHRPLGLSFQVNTNRSGIYAVALRNGAGSVSYVQNYTISAINTWQRVFLTFPETPATGYTWDYSSGVGLQVTWTLCAGATYQAAASAYTAMNALGTASQTNFLASAGNSWVITDIRLKVGAADTPIAYRPFAVEMAACQRYFWRGLPGTAVNGNAYTANCVTSWPVPFPVTMRATPSVSYVLTGSTFNVFMSASTTISQPSPDGIRLLSQASAAATNCSIVFGASDYIAADAEL